MKVINLTPTTQEFRMVEIVGGQGYTISIEAKGSTEIPAGFIVEHDKLDKKKFSVIEDGAPQVEEVVIAPVEDVTPEEEAAPQVEEIPVNEDKFICEICKAEFASARGLSSHMNRAHSDENK